MSFLERFSTVTKGDLIFIGNTLGLSKNDNQNSPGKVGSIGAFISLNQSEQVPNFPKGTTLDFKKNGSSAVLNLPKGSEVLYAELIWSGLYKSNKEDISKALDQQIIFNTPNGTKNISPEYRTKQDLTINLNNLTLGVYFRSSNVTDLIKRSKSGIYSVGGVPSIIDAIDSNTGKTNFAGWTLAVVYKNNELKPKRISFYVGLESVSEIENNKDVFLNSFEVSPHMDIANLLFSCGEGDAQITGDKVYFGKDLNSLNALSGPNNYENNFFASQINDKYGNQDVLGSFGNQNQNAKNNENISGGRQGWDITTINIKNLISEDCLKPVVRFSSTKDLFTPNAIGLSIDSSSANLKLTKSADKSEIIWGDLITYSIEIENIGDLPTKNITLNDSTTKCLKFVDHSIKVNGKSHSGNFPVVLSNLQPNEKHIVTFKMRVENQITKLAKNIANVKYSYCLKSGEIIKETCNSNELCLKPNGYFEKIKITKSVDKKTALKDDILTYTNIIENIGDVELTNILFHDSIPNNTIFVPGSVFIDNINEPTLNPDSAFYLKNLKPKETSIVTFQVKVIIN